MPSSSGSFRRNRVAPVGDSRIPLRGSTAQNGGPRVIWQLSSYRLGRLAREESYQRGVVRILGAKRVALALLVIRRVETG
jgi:hypothetical protein